jgi:hypothetical protein
MSVYQSVTAFEPFAKEGQAGNSVYQSLCLAKPLERETSCNGSIILHGLHLMKRLYLHR